MQLTYQIKKKRMSDEDMNVNVQRYSDTLVSSMSLENKISKMDEEIQKLQDYVTYLNMMRVVESDGTTKEGRRIYNMSNNRALMSSIRDVMSDTVFPHCKFIGKLDLQTIGKNSIGKLLMDRLQIGQHFKDVEQERVKCRLEWWGRNCELVERCLVDHKTKSAQNLKKKYMTGKYQQREMEFCNVFSI